LKDLNVDENAVIPLTIVVGGYNKNTDAHDSRPSHLTVTVKRGTNSNFKSFSKQK